MSDVRILAVRKNSRRKAPILYCNLDFSLFTFNFYLILHFAHSLFQVGDDVFCVFYSDGEAHEVGCDASLA